MNAVTSIHGHPLHPSEKAKLMDTLARCFDAEPVSRWLFSILILCSNTLPECPGCRAVQGGDWEQGLVVSVANNEVFSCDWLYP